MKKILISAGTSAAALALVFGATAQANPYDPFVGQTYAKVAEKLNGKVTIASRVGEYLPTDQCIVTGSRKLSFKDASGRGGASWQVDLNCNDTSALNGHAGNSVATPAGKKALQQRELAKNFSANYETSIAAGKTPICGKNDEYIQYCQKICRVSKACSAELAEYVGA